MLTHTQINQNSAFTTRSLLSLEGTERISPFKNLSSCSFVSSVVKRFCLIRVHQRSSASYKAFNLKSTADII